MTLGEQLIYLLVGAFGITFGTVFALVLIFFLADKLREK